MTALMVALGAALGAPARFLVDRAFGASRFPFGTLLANVAASLLLGVVAGASEHVSASVFALVAIGFCGSLSTFSTFSYDVLRLAEARETVVASVYVLLSVGLALAAVALGWWVGTR